MKNRYSVPANVNIQDYSAPANVNIQDENLDYMAKVSIKAKSFTMGAPNSR